jgi:hypothetical protein
VDRLDAMKVFIVALDEGSLAAAGRKLGRSPRRCQPRHRLSGGAHRHQTAAPDNAIDQDYSKKALRRL